MLKRNRILVFGLFLMVLGTAMILAGIVMSASAASAMPMDETSTQRHIWKPCKYEDGSSRQKPSKRACVWDALHMGNGVGDSLKILRGGEDNAVYKVISHERAHYLLGWN